ncbi:hypothetical protein CLAIMM_00664 [Cladophialophora immunda]|nr:hypothetical protein CLAIMM_00664 [Cladophialophora immunda]
MLCISMWGVIKTTEDARVLTDIVGCLKNAFDLEYRIDCGQTQLLFTSLLTNSFALRILIANGANTQATDEYGRGALHSALYPHSFIVLPNSCDISEFPCDTFHQCTCPSVPQAHDRHYALYISENFQMDVSRLEPTLLVLLNAQCDPNMRDHYGLTPSDYARRNAGIWEIWHTALQEAGYAYDEESGYCYKTYLEFI